MQSVHVTPAGRYAANEPDRPRDIQMWRTERNRWQYRVAITVSAVLELWNCFADRTAVWRPCHFVRSVFLRLFYCPDLFSFLAL